MAHMASRIHDHNKIAARQILPFPVAVAAHKGKEPLGVGGLAMSARGTFAAYDSPELLGC
jgi:hypothetical protein